MPLTSRRPEGGGRDGGVGADVGLGGLVLDGLGLDGLGGLFVAVVLALELFLAEVVGLAGEDAVHGAEAVEGVLAVEEVTGVEVAEVLDGVVAGEGGAAEEDG